MGVDRLNHRVAEHAQAVDRETRINRHSARVRHRITPPVQQRRKTLRPGVRPIQLRRQIIDPALANPPHRVSEQFPDGQLYANLRGYSTSPPALPIDVLSQFLRSLGIAPEQVPLDVDTAAALYRTMLAGKPRFCCS